MECLRELLGYVPVTIGLGFTLAAFAFYQFKDDIIGWFQFLRGDDPEISDDEMPPTIEDSGPASRTRSTVPEYDRDAVKAESKNFALKHFGLYPENNSNEESEESEPPEELSNQSHGTPNEESEEEKIK